MGIISYFKNLHYDKKLNKAGRLLNDGSFQAAEEIYLSLVDKHPQAAYKLAEYYYVQSTKADVKKVIALFKKAFDLKKKGLGVYDATTYGPVLSNFAKYIKSRASSCFESGAFDDSFVLASVLIETKTGSKDVNVLCSESKIRMLFRDIAKTAVTSKSFKPLIEAFRQEWPVCKDKLRATKSAAEFCEQLANSKRFYASNELLSIVLGDSYAEKCLNNAVQIVKGLDSEASYVLVKSVVKTFGKRIILREGVSQGDSVSLFDACWHSSFDDSFAMDLLKSASDSSLRDAFIANILNKHSAYLSSEKFFKEFTSWIFNSFDSSSSLDLLEKILKLGYNVEELFTKKTHSLISGKSCDESLPYIERALQLLPNSSVIIDDKLDCAQRYLNDGENVKAVAVADSILDKRENAKLIKAHALCNIADTEQNLDKRIEQLEQAQSTLSSYSGPEKEVIATCINYAFVLAAKLYYGEGETDKSYTVLAGLAKKGVEKAADAIANLRLQEVQTVKTTEDKLIRATSAIGELRKLGISTIVNNPDFQQLWDERIKALLAQYKTLDNKAAVTHYESLINEIDSAGFDATVAKDKKSDVVKQIIKRKYLVAKDSELSGDLTTAADLYKEINALEAKRVPTLSALRFILCKLKSQNSTEILGHRERIYTLLRNAADAYKSEKNDIAYRFALILLKAGEDKEALSVLDEFLPEEGQLRKACEQETMIKALAKLDDFNGKLEAVKNKTLSSKDAVYFINHMLEYAETIAPVLKLPLTILSHYRNNLKNYAIFKMFDEAKYDVAFTKMIKEHQDYLDDYTALRNIAIICLNMAETKQITSTNFQEVIAVWLTAIYQEKLFIKSLDYTSWDDKFTFSLYDAYGHFNEDSVGDLPDNVNFSESNDSSVVLIKEVQRALLDRFEAAISDTQCYHEFFTSQKDTMDSFIALNLYKKCRIVAPYLAHKDAGVFHDISDALEQDRKQKYDNWEDVLAVGASYQMPQSIYSDYSNAKSYYEDCITAMDTFKASVARRAFTSSKIDFVRKFDKLSSALTSYCNSKISSLSAKNKADFKNNYSFYLPVCNSMKDRTLSFIFSNYVMQYVVGEVNGNTMNKSDAADIILSIFLLDKNNSKVKENLETLFEMLSRDSSTASEQAVTNVLNKIQTFDTSFYNKLKSEYEHAKIDKEMNDIVDKVNNNQLSEAKALDRVYALYSTNPSNDRICENLVQLCDMCIAKYIVKQEYGGSSVSTILDRLKGNMSITFKIYNVKLKQTYQSIWNSLPSDARLTLKGLNPNATLNSSGQALKRGLDYYKALGGVNDTSSLSDIFGHYR